MKDTITDAMKAAMRAQDKPRLGTIRLILSAIKQFEVDKQTPASDADVLQILTSLSKQRRDSITQFEAADRPDLVEKEQVELAVVQSFLPTPLTEQETKEVIAEAIAALNASSLQDMGKIIQSVRPQLLGRADMGQVSQWIKDALSG